MNTREVHRGDIWYVDLGQGQGSEQRGVKPCLVVQNDKGNECSSITIVCPITSKLKLYNATHVAIFGDGLKVPSYVLCEQIRVIDQSRLERKLGTLNEDMMLDVESKIKLNLGL